MSRIDIGKDAKRNGSLQPSHARKLDPMPPRATPAAKPHRKVEKPFGFSYERYNWWRRLTGVTESWTRRYAWFKSEQAANQAMRAFLHKHGNDPKYYRDIRAERRDAK